ncbi:MAG: hypothetical protein AB7T06_25880 [Kofleriaceae bacterium]
MTNLVARAGALAVAALSMIGTGCGLISSDVTNFDLTLPDKNFTIDASGWQVDETAATALTSTSCANSPAVCASAADQACPEDCTGRCGSSQTCELDLDVGLYQMIDLLREKPELQSINDEPIIKVTIDSVTYEVTTNTLNVDTPAMEVYVAPMSVMDPNDPLAKHVGTIPAVPAGMTVSMPQTLMFTADGKAELVDIMSTFKTPFNLIVGSTLTVKSGTPVPMGRLDAVVHIKGHAGL